MWPTDQQSLADRPPIIGRPAMLGLHSMLLSSSISSYSSHAHSTDQKYQKQSQFLSSFPKFFLYIFLKFVDFILCNDEIDMLWKRSK
jgi:hypothetical protein